MAGNPRPKGSKPDKLMRDAIMLALHRQAVDGQPTKKLNVIADALVDLAAAGDMQAIKEVNDRVDGRAHQTAEITHVNTRASELSDDVLAGYIPSASGDGAIEAPVDPQKLN